MSDFVGRIFSYLHDLFRPKPSATVPSESHHTGLRYNEGPRDPRILPSAATVRELEAIGKNVTIEGYFNEDTNTNEYIVYTGDPSGKTVTSHSENGRIPSAVNECLRKDGLDTRSVYAIPSTKSQMIQNNEPGWDMSPEVTHVCGDPDQTALRGPNNFYMEDWEMCGCDQCQSSRPGA